MLADYENLNHDLPKDLRRQLALFVLAPKTGVKILEELFQRPLGQTLLRHRSWMWWTAMRTSGLERHWEPFRTAHNTGTSVCSCLRGLKNAATTEQWLLFSKRLGIPVFRHDRASLNPYNYGRKGSIDAIWTKGGTWSRRNSITRILILGEHLERINEGSKMVMRMDPARCIRLESELHYLCVPDAMLVPDVITQAIEYARYRIPKLANTHWKHASYKTVAWFFQTRIPHPHGGFMKHDQEAGYPMKNSQGKDWSWLP